MRKVIAAINMTIDVFCDHIAISSNEEIHQHYADLLSNAGTLMYGRITYQLMEFWRTLVQNLSGEKSMDDFAIVIDAIPKLVFSRTLKNVDWKSTKLAKGTLEQEILNLKLQSVADIFVGSRSLIVQLMKLNLIDELQLMVHTVIAGSGLPLFEQIDERTILKLVNTKTFSSVAVTIYYKPAKN